MYQFKNKSDINATHNSAVILHTSGERAPSTLSQLAANLRKLNVSAVPASPVLQHRSNYPYHCRNAIDYQSVPLSRDVTKKFAPV